MRWGEGEEETGELAYFIGMFCTEHKSVYLDSRLEWLLWHLTASQYSYHCHPFVEWCLMVTALIPLLCDFEEAR